MAEGGFDPIDPGEGDNPFSFKRFLKERTVKTDDEDESNSLSSSDVSRVNSRKTSKEDTTLNADLRPTENPFSFKHFLRSKGPKSTRLLDESMPFTATSNGRSEVPPDFAANLPDFVQTSSSRESLHSRRSVSPSYYELEQELNGSSSALLGAAAAALGDGDTPVSDDPDYFSLERNLDIGELPSPNMPTGLPDFLSDSGVRGSASSNSHARNHLGRSPSEDDDDIVAQIRILREQNQELHLQLTLANQLAESETARATQLGVQLDALRNRESQETRALELMVQQVESNLALANERAIKAESTVTRLKQEVKELKSQLAFVLEENKLLQTGVSNPSAAERTRGIAAQIRSAATQAESDLKSLLAGTENLRLLADALRSVHKISEFSECNGAPKDGTS